MSYNPIPPRVWSRVQNPCTYGITDTSYNVYIPLIKQTVSQAQANYEDKLIYKGNILQYKGNSARLTKSQKYTQLAKMAGPNRTKVFATQSQTYTNPNTTNLRRKYTQTYQYPNPIVGAPNNPSGPFQYNVANPNECSGVSIQDGGTLVCGTYINPCTGDIIKQLPTSATICNPASASDVPGSSFLCWNNKVQTWFPRQRYFMNNSTDKWPQGYKGFVSAKPFPFTSTATYSYINDTNCNFVVTFTGSGTITFNNNFNINVIAVGGGGGGGGGSHNHDGYTTLSGGGGGGGGGIGILNNFTITSAISYSITVGGYGIGGDGNNGGGNGGDSSFKNGATNYLTASGGLAGGGFYVGTSGGLGGNATSITSITSYNGGNGGDGYQSVPGTVTATSGSNTTPGMPIGPIPSGTTYYFSGGGGGGVYTSTYTGGSAGNNGIGGTVGGNSVTNGQAALSNSYGSGGGGGGCPSGNNQRSFGGNGASGIVIIYFTY